MDISGIRIVEGDGDSMFKWRISYSCTDWDGEESGEGRRIDVGSMTLVPYEPGIHSFDDLDADSAGLSNFGSMLDLRRGGLNRDLAKRLLEPWSERMLIIDTLEVEPELRGYGLGTLLVAEAVSFMTRGDTAVVATFPCPIDRMDEVRTDEAKDKVCKKLATVYKPLGFKQFKRTGLYFADPASFELTEAIQQVRKHFNITVNWG